MLYHGISNKDTTNIVYIVGLYTIMTMKRIKYKKLCETLRRNKAELGGES